jgi:hypothetical protein
MSQLFAPQVGLLSASLKTTKSLLHSVWILGGGMGGGACSPKILAAGRAESRSSLLVHLAVDLDL